MAAPQYAYDAFLSYVTEADYDLARDLEAFLERFHELPTPEAMPLRPLSVWRDGSDVSAKEASSHADIARLLEFYMTQCRYLILLWSTRSVHAHWTRFELRWFLENRDPQSIFLGITDALDPNPNSRELFTPEVRRAGLTHRPWYDFRGFHGAKLAGALRLRDFDDARVQLAADLNGYRPSEIQPLWWRNKVREQEERAEREERARRRIEVAECDARLEAANGWYERAFTAFRQRRYGEASRFLVEAVTVADPARVPDHYPATSLNPGWAENAWAFLRYALALTPTLRTVDLTERAPQSGVAAGLLPARELPVKGLAWMNRGRSIAVLGDHILKAYDHANGELVSTIQPPAYSGPITAWSAARQNDLIILGTERGFVMVWSHAGTTTASDTHRAAVTAAAIAADGARAATGSGDGEIRLWSGLTEPGGTPVSIVLRSIDGEEIEHIQFALHDTALLFVAGNKLKLKEFSGKEDAELLDFFTQTCLAVDDDGLNFAYSDEDIVHRSELGHPEESVLYVGEHRTFVKQIAFAAGGAHLFTRDLLGTTCVWLGRDEPLERGQSFMGGRYTKTFGHTNRGSLLKNLEEVGPIDIVAPHPGDPSRFLVCRDRAVAEGELGFAFVPIAGWRHAASGVRRAVWLPDATGIVAGADDGSVSVLRLDAARSVVQVAELDAAVGDVGVSRDGKLIAAVAEDGSIAVASLPETRVLATVRTGSVPFAVAFAGQADEEVAVGCQDGVIQLWTWQRSGVPRRLGACDGPIRRLEINGARTVLVAGTDSGELSSWDLREGLELWSTADYPGIRWTGSIESISISPDDKLVAYGAMLGSVGCLDLATGSRITSTPLHPSVPDKPEQVTAVGIADDNRTAVAGLWDGTLCVVDLKLGRELYRFPAHTKVITAAAQAPLGGTVLTASLDDHPDNDFVRAWNLLDVQAIPAPQAKPDGWAQATRAAFERRYGHKEPGARAAAVPGGPQAGSEPGIVALRDALVRDPRSPQRNLDLAAALIEAGHTERAQDYVARACRFGGADLICDPRLQALAGRVFLGEGQTEQGMAWLRKAADQHEPSALMQLGLMHLTGDQVDRDEGRGLAYLHESAELGDPVAAYNLGVYHEHFAGGFVRRTDWRSIAFGESGGEDPELSEALRWYRRAAEQGYEPAEEAVDRLASPGLTEKD